MRKKPPQAPGDSEGASPDPGNMTDEEIEQATSVFSFDLTSCRSRFTQGDDWQRVIQAHLFFDHVLSGMITEALRSPGHLNLDRTAFSAKLDLAASLALIDNSTKSFLKQMNRLRNSIAHDLEFVVSKEDVLELYNLTPKPGRVLIDEECKKSNGTLLLGTVLVNLVLLDIFRQKWAARRLLQARRKHQLAAAMENARRVLRKIDGRE